MDEQRKRYIARMDDLQQSAAETERRAGLKPGAIRDYLGRNGRDGNDPSIEKAVALANAVDWTLEQFYNNVEKIRLRLHVEGISRGPGMWSSFADKKKQTIPLDLPTHGLVAINISHDGEAPHAGLRAGDTVVGTKFDGPNFGNLVRTECIVQTVDGQQLLGVLRPGTKKGRYNIQPFEIRSEPITDVEVAWVAPIKLIIRGDH